MELRGKSVVVVGAGSSGVAAVRLLTKRGARVTLNDRKDQSAFGESLRDLAGRGVKLALGDHPATIFEDAELVVVSPGVPPLRVLEGVAERGVEVIAEVELASRFISAPMVCITGTNGKSTVTTLVAEIGAAAGRPTFGGGNLGMPLSDAVESPANQPGGLVVAELSSFQLERVHELTPRVAVLLNLSPDHLDRYESYEAYASAKGNIFRGQSEDCFAVIPQDDAAIEGLAANGRAQVFRFGLNAGDVHRAGDEIVDRGNDFRFPISRLALQGKHNILNASASILAARLLGLPADAIERGLATVRALPHRAQLVREFDSVAFIDDSKATNVGAAVAALDGLATPNRKAVLIAGGVDKGGSYAPLAERMAKVGRALITIGQAAATIEDELEPALGSAHISVHRAATMQDAVRLGHALAQPGDIVLLAPACSSYDMYNSFAERGRAFQAAVATLGSEAGNAR